LEDSEHEGSEHEGSEHEGSEHEGSEHEGSEHEGSEHEGSEGNAHEGSDDSEYEGIEHSTVQEQNLCEREEQCHVAVGSERGQRERAMRESRSRTCANEKSSVMLQWAARESSEREQEQNLCEREEQCHVAVDAFLL
jgi:hypothetical protein